MKKVRFKTPNPVFHNSMDHRECHSPRPFFEKQPSCNSIEYCERVLPYSKDPVHRYECSNSSPYPLANKTSIPQMGSGGTEWLPSNDLDLSMLDASSQEPRRPVHYKPATFKPPVETPDTSPQVLSSIENHKTSPNVLSKDNSFFIRRDNIDKYYNMNRNTLQHQLNTISLNKENDPITKKLDFVRMELKPISPVQVISPKSPTMNTNILNDSCKCHHCVKPVPSITHLSQHTRLQSPCHNVNTPPRAVYQCHCVPSPRVTCQHCDRNIQRDHKSCHCEAASSSASPQNAVDKKTWAIEKYEQSKKAECMDVEKQTNIVKEKREPTVADLFRIIKLQNEQLQLLQEKVDKFISVGNMAQNKQLPLQNYTTENELQTVSSQVTEQHKISIGVMTSFELVRTSTVINQEFVKQTMDNAQIQCNRSQISIKEVVSKAQPANFLDGIMPFGQILGNEMNNVENRALQSVNVIDDKTVNDLSLCNVQVDNATTPLISPEQSMYLDVRDYSDSDSSSDDHSNVGWTYYNKVMTHVNGMLQDSDMPSSASALYRNTRQQCVQMQIDKTNVSVTKRVKFGDDPLGVQQPHIYAACTDTSMKMNQLAAKYLKTPASIPQRQASKPMTKPIDMSFATRNYMERHKLLQAAPTPESPPPGEMPRFLDITALKQQPKLL